MKRERGVDERLVVSSHLTHKLERLDNAGKQKSWLDFFEDQRKRVYKSLKEKPDLRRPTMGVIDSLIKQIGHALENNNDFYLSILYWDDIPWLLLLAYEGQDSIMIRYLLRTPISYEHMQKRCAQQKNLLPTLLSVTVYGLLPVFPQMHRLEIPAPFDITVYILEQMEKDNPRIMSVVQQYWTRFVVLKDATAFSLLWQKQKHCAEPIAGLCGGCMQVAYCSRECQAENWAFHRHECDSGKK